MSDAAPETGSASVDHDRSIWKKDGSNGGGLLRIVLIGLLIVMLGVLAYDRYARSASAAAFEKVEEWVNQNKEATPADVHELIGREPDNGLIEKGHYYEETYSWRRGILVNTYFVTVLYGQKDGKPVLHEVEQNKIPEDNSIPNPEPPELDPADIDPPRSNPSVDPAVSDGAEPSSGENAPANDGAAEKSSPGDAAEAATTP